MTNKKNVCAALGLPDADAMLIKAQLATEIGELIKMRRSTLQCTPEVSQWLRGHFRDASEAQMREVLTRLRLDSQ
jgi:hypothetical protein